MNLLISYEKYNSSYHIPIGLWNFISFIKEIDNDKELNLHLLISGSHLSKEYGKTISEIIQ